MRVDKNCIFANFYRYINFHSSFIRYNNHYYKYYVNKRVYPKELVQRFGDNT